MSFRFLTAGESHGKALLGIIEGVPSGVDLSPDDLQMQMRRRKLGYGRGARQKIETDSVEILSGIRHGKTLGSPIGLVITNQDWKAWQDIMQAEPFSGEVRRKVEVPRPGHADYIGGIKYDHADMRNVLERASARETAMRVALGTVARRFLEELGISIASRVVRIGNVTDETALDLPVASLNEKVDQSPVRCLGAHAEKEMISLIERAKKDGDTLGGVVETYADGAPVALGSYAQWDRRLEGEIAKAFMSLNAIKGVEVGMGFQAATLPGSMTHDEFQPSSKKRRATYKTNRSGGIDGGMTTGQPLVIRAAMKPIATLMKPLQSVKLDSGEPVKAHVERSDVCAVPAAGVITESLLALVLAAACLEKFGGDSIGEIQERVRAWRLHSQAD